MANTINTLNTLIASSPVWTSTIYVQPYQRLNVSIRIGGSFVSAPTVSTFSGIIHLQRQFTDASDVSDDIWRDVGSWTILATEALDGGTEEITALGDMESANYRMGVKSGNYYSVGGAFVRLGSWGGKV